jgi:4-hydroxybenzoate polyprenyltransferase
MQQRDRYPSGLSAILRASRTWKVLPLVLVLTNATLLPTRSVQWVVLAVAGAYVLVVSILGMQLNVITDEELDRATKPELAQQLNARPVLLGWVIAAEIVASLLLLLLLYLSGHGGVELLWPLLLYGVLFTCYSFNFFVPGRAAEFRLKAFWWGNALAALGCYAALWLAGVSTAGVHWSAEPRWLALAIALSLLDYGVFLVECAEDAADERAHSLATLPALLGRGGTTLVAVSLVAAGVLGISWFISGSSGATAYALILVALAQSLAAFAALRLNRASRGTDGKRPGEQLVDFASWFTRLGMLGLLIAGYALR